MMFKQPTSGHEWVPENEIPSIVSQILNMTEDQEVGYYFDCDLYYDPALHSQHSSFPVAPYNMTITEDMLSPFARECHQLLNGKVKYQAKKLCTTFGTRKHYGVHYLNLRTYLQLGLKIIKVHRILKFKQTAFLRTYAGKVTSLRQKAKTPFGQRLFKLFNNR